MSISTPTPAHAPIIDGAPDITSPTGTPRCLCGWQGEQSALYDAFMAWHEHQNEVWQQEALDRESPSDAST